MSTQWTLPEDRFFDPNPAQREAPGCDWHAGVHASRRSCDPFSDRQLDRRPGNNLAKLEIGEHPSPGQVGLSFGTSGEPDRRASVRTGESCYYFSDRRGDAASACR